jgi:hypothetical protein
MITLVHFIRFCEPLEVMGVLIGGACLPGFIGGRKNR